MFYIILITQVTLHFDIIYTNNNSCFTYSVWISGINGYLYPPIL